MKREVAILIKMCAIHRANLTKIYLRPYLNNLLENLRINKALRSVEMIAGQANIQDAGKPLRYATYEAVE